MSVSTKYLFLLTGIMLGLAAMTAQPAQASLVGDQIHGALYANGGSFNYFSPDSAVVSDPGVEFLFEDTFDSNLFADFGDSTLTLGIFTGHEDRLGANIRFVFTDLNWSNPAAQIVGLNLLRNDFEWALANYGFGPDLIWIDIINFGYHAPNTNILAEFEFVTGDAPAVPEPTTMSLLGLGLAGLGLARKLRSRA